MGKNKTNISIGEWISLSEQDLDVASILYKKGYYPHSLYFLVQATEKLQKSILLFCSFIEKGQDIGHNLIFGLSKIFEHSAGKDIDKYIEKIKIKEEDLDYKNKFSNLMKLVKSNKDLSKRIKTMHTLRKIRPPKRIDERKILKIIIKFNKELKTIKKLEQKLGKELSKKVKKDEKDFVKLRGVLKEALNKFMKYPVVVVYSLSYYLPNQNSFRYPEYIPKKTYNKNHPLIKNFKMILKHLKESRLSLKRFITILNFLEGNKRK